MPLLKPKRTRSKLTPDYSDGDGAWKLRYVDLYDRAMPEVIRIERAWPTPSTEENIAVVYPEQREEAKRAKAADAAKQVTNY